MKHGFLAGIFIQLQLQLRRENALLPKVRVHDIAEEPTAGGKMKQIVNRIDDFQKHAQHSGQEMVQ